MTLTFIQTPCVIMNYRKDNKITLHLSSIERKQCNECKVHLLTLDNPEGFLVSSIIVVYSGFKSKVIIPQQQCQHSPFEINKHHYSSITINLKVFDTGLMKD